MLYDLSLNNINIKQYKFKELKNNNIDLYSNVKQRSGTFKIAITKSILKYSLEQKCNYFSVFKNIINYKIQIYSNNCIVLLFNVILLFNIM